MMLGKAFVGIMALRGITRLITAQMQAIDSTAKLTDTLSMTTESLVALQHAAQIAGVETKMFNKSIETMLRRLGEVRLGVGEAQYALDMLGLSADDLVAKSPAKTLELIAQRLQTLPHRADQAVGLLYDGPGRHEAA